MAGGLAGIDLAAVDESFRDLFIEGEVDEDHELDRILHFVALGHYGGTWLYSVTKLCTIRWRVFLRASEVRTTSFLRQSKQRQQKIFWEKVYGALDLVTILSCRVYRYCFIPYQQL